ncbi:hypothetical protein HYY71_04080 [Candidatus Woesearchaeota archaeon]|nr:hypothetical protein [Candidatus Woesearchaeota archaeon]
MNSYRNQKISLVGFMNEKSEDIRVRLSNEFQQMVFSELIYRFSSVGLGKIFNISRPMVYHYRSYRVNNISLDNLNKIVNLMNLKEELISNNTIGIFKNEDIRKACLNLGRNFRINQLKNFRNQIPKINDIIEDNSLNLEKWFCSYKNLINFGCREIKAIETKDNKLEVTYTNYANSKKKTFTTLFPRIIKIDEDFQYFLGLWVGDKAGGGRIGVMNKNKILNLYTSDYLIKLYQKPLFVLYTHSERIPELDYKIDKVIRIKGFGNGHAISVHAINSILKSFFGYLESNLDNLLMLIPNRNIFFAGLFDAEGNVFFEDKCFRWSSKNAINIKIFIKHLSQMNLFHRFDGSNLVTYNFADKILPFIKHPQKINDANLLCYKDGALNNRFMNILNFIHENPGKSAKEIAKALKRVKVYSQLKFLEYIGLVRMDGYPHKMFTTTQGVASLSHGGKDL